MNPPLSHRRNIPQTLLQHLELAPLVTIGCLLKVPKEPEVGAFLASPTRRHAVTLLINHTKRVLELIDAELDIVLHPGRSFGTDLAVCL